MKKIKFNILVVLLLVLTLGITLSACNNDNSTGPSEEDTESEESNAPFDIPPEVLEKVNEIYSKHSTNPQEIVTVHDLAILTSINMTIKGEGPIGVCEAKLNNENITLITLGGTEFVDGQATTVEESKLASENKSNDYLKAVEKLFINEVIPKDKPVMITGISLGGMIAQQLVGSSVVRDNYEIKAVVTFGSPLTMPVDRKGVKVVRFEDSHDLVPGLGEMMLSKHSSKQSIRNAHLNERIERETKFTEMIETHALSYISAVEWLDYDFLGMEKNTNTLKTLSKIVYYDAPKLA